MSEEEKHFLKVTKERIDMYYESLLDGDGEDVFFHTSDVKKLVSIIEKQQIENNWNKLKEWLEDYKKQCDYEIKKGIALHTYDEIDRNRRYGDITHCLENTLKQMQEIEDEMND